MPLSPPSSGPAQADPTSVPSTPALQAEPSPPAPTPISPSLVPPAAVAGPSGQLPPSSASQPAAATASDVSEAGSTSAPPAPTATDSPDSRVHTSTRIAKRKKSAAIQAEVRRQNKRLVFDKETAAAQAARETAVALGSASTAAFTPLRIRSQPASAPKSAPRTPAPTLPAPAAPLPSGPASPSAAPTTAPPSRPASQRRPSAPEPLPAQMNTEASPTSTNYRQASAATLHPAPTHEPAPAVLPPGHGQRAGASQSPDT
ncbi:hypothetical protein JG687_00018779 [Phytophthora cactorum]|uniref:Uncharacterized protein n=1 Tax=Phytophthora cactorum TaxID=29920 RepID=A0A8T1TN73_9STRA|nr:hypothetical protein PC123_g23003 [Phytophthora cactorum]KAG6942929.1 hypothetical protein JG687_00018779 [Phytophthora cactorum]